MAQIIEEESGKKKGGKRRPKKHSTHIDMTPMVDLMCLLITFFMLTTAFSKPKVMEIVLPKDKKDEPKQKEPETKILDDRTYNFIVAGDNKLYYYIGKPDKTAKLIKTDYSKDGLRKLLLEKNKGLFTAIFDLKEAVAKGKKKLSDSALTKEISKLKEADLNNNRTGGPIILIKATDKAKYKNMVNLIDEMAITNIGRYFIVDILPIELEMLKNTDSSQF